VIHTISLGALCRDATPEDREWLSGVRAELRAYTERTLYPRDAGSEP
jgi:hypothetical protein